ncbi:MAG: flavin reductase family protein [Actinobacteria bacterium]|nr:flavin reductase family protein [Actinomycetota bacterium]
MTSNGETGRVGAPAAEEFRDVIGHFASGVTVITTSADGEPLGTTASAVTSLSLEPPMLLVCLKQDSATGAAIARGGRFAVNILHEGQAELARRFATKGPGKFDGVAVLEGAAGMPLIADALAQVECEVAEEVVGGTHSVFLAHVLGAAAAGGRPLAYFRGRFGRLRPAVESDAPDRAGS